MLISLLDWYTANILVGFGIDDRIEIPVGGSLFVKLRAAAICGLLDANAGMKGDNSPIFPIAIGVIPWITNPPIPVC